MAILLIVLLPPYSIWWASEDSNLKSFGYEPSALASYARGPIRKEVGDCYAVLNPDGTIFKRVYDNYFGCRNGI